MRTTIPNEPRTRTSLPPEPGPLTKKLKVSKFRIELKDGTELHYHAPDKPERDLNLHSFLPQDHSALEVEIGCGKGEYLSDRAKRFEDRFFIGIDRRRDRFILTEKKLKKAKVDNWKLLREDARSFLEHGLPLIDILHIYHPDPWPKARHNKHRFFRSPDALTWARAIKPGGEFRISTDHKEYYEEILAIVMSWELFDLKICWTKTHGTPNTHFEKIFLRKREPVFKVHFVRKENT